VAAAGSLEVSLHRICGALAGLGDAFAAVQHSAAQIDASLTGRGSTAGRLRLRLCPTSVESVACHGRRNPWHSTHAAWEAPRSSEEARSRPKSRPSPQR
jgi:hypothetical protein